MTTNPTLASTSLIERLLALNGFPGSAILLKDTRFGLGANSKGTSSPADSVPLTAAQIIQASPLTLQSWLENPSVTLRLKAGLSKFTPHDLARMGAAQLDLLNEYGKLACIPSSILGTMPKSLVTELFRLTLSHKNLDELIRFANNLQPSQLNRGQLFVLLSAIGSVGLHSVNPAIFTGLSSADFTALFNSLPYDYLQALDISQLGSYLARIDATLFARFTN